MTELTPTVITQLALRRLHPGKEDYYIDFNQKKLNAWYGGGLPPFNAHPSAHADQQCFSNTARGFQRQPARRSPQRANLNFLLAQGNTAGLYYKSIDWNNVDALAGFSALPPIRLTMARRPICSRPWPICA